MNAGRRNQSSITLSNRQSINGDSNGSAKPSRREAPSLQRSKSDYGPRGESTLDHDEERQDWGARHGFDGHYVSDEFVSQLVHVSGSFHMVKQGSASEAGLDCARGCGRSCDHSFVKMAGNKLSCHANGLF